MCAQSLQLDDGSLLHESDQKMGDQSARLQLGDIQEDDAEQLDDSLNETGSGETTSQGIDHGGSTLAFQHVRNTDRSDFSGIMSMEEKKE